MSDTKLRPEDLTAEEIHAATAKILADPLLHRFYNWSVNGCRALFAPAPVERSTDPNCGPYTHHWNFGFCYTCNKPGRDQGDAPEPAAPEISELDDRHMRMASPEAQAKFRADMDRRAIEIGMERLVGVANHPISETVTVGTWQLEELLKYADLAEVSLRTGFSPPDFLGVDLPYLLRSSIAVVLQQAAQGRMELGKVRELIFMVRNLTPYLAQLGYADLSRSFNDYADAALAEIDAAEGKRTAGEHMSELSGEPLPHYLRDARLTANGMRAAAEIARNFRPKSACTCGGYISFHYGIPCHQPGCPVGECLEIADEIDARADEIDETPDRWLAELDAADGKGEGRG